MSLKLIRPEKTYSAEGLFRITEGEPFGWGLAKWKRELLTAFSGLKFTRKAKNNCAYRVKGQHYIDFVGNPDTLKKFPPRVGHNPEIL